MSAPAAAALAATALATAAVALLGCGGAPPPDMSVTPAPLEVALEQGRYRGAAEGGARAFLGVPFAQPPVGDLRFRPPQALAPVTADAAADATAFGPDPVQHNLWGDMNYRGGHFSEDCLYLNVWTPAELPADSLLPVLVYFYGGGFVAGSASETRYDGAALAREGVVVVAPNYRLNAFGFLSHPELSAESGYGASGNYGLLDQVAALEWVRKYVGAFGGDPARVTIGGESAGSLSVSMLLTSPRSRGLVAGGIGQSGAAIHPTYHPLDPREAEAVGAAFAAFAVGPGEGALARLRALPADTLYARYLRFRDSGGEGFREVLDGHFLTETIPEAYAAGSFADVPLLAGWTTREGGADRFVSDPDAPEADVVAAFERGVAEAFGADAPAVLAAYPHGTRAETLASAQALAGDRFIAYATWRWTDLHRARAEAPAWRYLFAQARPGAEEGAPHASDIPYALGNLDVHADYPYTDDDRAASATMLAYFANFVKHGDPNGADAPGAAPAAGAALPNWPALPRDTADGTPVMRIAGDSEAERVGDGRYRVLEAVYGSEPDR